MAMHEIGPLLHVFPDCFSLFNKKLFGVPVSTRHRTTLSHKIYVTQPHYLHSRSYDVLNTRIYTK